MNAENLGVWLAAGAAAVGAGRELIPAAALAQCDFDAIETLARRFVAALAEARSGQ